MGICPVGHDSDTPLVKLITQQFMQDPYPDLAAYRESRSAVAVENGGFRMWLVTGYDDARSLLADPLTKRDVISNRDHLIGKALVRPERKPHIPRALRVGMIDRDGDDHRRLRGVVSKYFSPVTVAARRPAIERIVDGLLAQLPTGESFDLVERFSQPVAAAVVADLLGLEPSDDHSYPRWVNSMLAGESVKDAQSGAQHLIRFTKEIIERKRADPERTSRRTSFAPPTRERWTRSNWNPPSHCCSSRAWNRPAPSPAASIPCCGTLTNWRRCGLIRSCCTAASKRSSVMRARSGCCPRAIGRSPTA